MSLTWMGGPNPGEKFPFPSPLADAGEEVYADVKGKWVLVKVLERRIKSVLLSITWQYDVSLENETHLNIPESKVRTVKDHQKTIDAGGETKNQEAENQGK